MSGRSRCRTNGARRSAATNRCVPLNSAPASLSPIARMSAPKPPIEAAAAFRRGDPATAFQPTRVFGPRRPRSPHATSTAHAGNGPRGQAGVASWMNRDRSACGSVRDLPPMSSTVSPSTTRACFASQSSPAGVAEVTLSAGSEPGFRVGDELDLDVVAVPTVDDVVARTPRSTSSPAPPVSTSSPSLPMRMSSPSPPLPTNWIAPTCRPRRPPRQRQPAPSTVTRSEATSAPVMFTWAARPNTVTPLASPTTQATSSPVCPGRSRCRPGGRRRRTTARLAFDLRRGGAAEVVHHDRVGTTDRVTSIRSTPSRSITMPGDVAGQPHPAGGRGDADVLGDVGGR